MHLKRLITPWWAVHLRPFCTMIFTLPLVPSCWCPRGRSVHRWRGWGRGFCEWCCGHTANHGRSWRWRGWWPGRPETRRCPSVWWRSGEAHGHFPPPAQTQTRVCYGLTLNCCAFYNISVYGCVQIRRKELHDIPVAEEWLQMLPYNLIYY